MGMFNKKTDLKNETSTGQNDHNELLRLREEYDKRMMPVRNNSLYVYTKADPGVSEIVGDYYYINETEDNYVCRMDSIGKGITSSNISLYKKTLEADDLVLPKSKYKLVLPKDNIAIEQMDEFEEIWKIRDIHIEIRSEENVYSFYFKPVQQSAEVMEAFIKDGIQYDFKDLLQIPNDAHIVTLRYGSPFHHSGEYFIWRDRANLFMLKDVSRIIDNEKRISVLHIPINQIVYYKNEGDLRYEQQIYGGGGGGANIENAIIGGLLFGATGAIVGSQVGTEIAPISSETVAVDTRLVMLVFMNSHGKRLLAIFDSSATAAMEWYISEKEYTYIIEKRRSFFERQENSETQS